MKVTVSHYSSISTGFIYCKLGHTILLFPHVIIVRLIIFITAECLETISNVAYNISDPSNDKYPRKEGFARYENMIFYFATCQMYLFVCLNHCYCENNKDSFFFRCNGNEVIVVVAIHRQYLYTVHLVRK